MNKVFNIHPDAAFYVLGVAMRKKQNERPRDVITDGMETLIKSMDVYSRCMAWASGAVVFVYVIMPAIGRMLSK